MKKKAAKKKAVGRNPKVHISLRVSEEAILNCKQLADESGIYFNQVVDLAMKSFNGISVVK